MIYKSFSIKKYKGIDSVLVNFGRDRIITLVGLNESGKTTMMEAIALFYKMIKGDQPTEQQLNKFRPKGASFTGIIEISSTLILEQNDKTKILKYWQTDLQKRGALEIPDEFTYTFKFIFQINTFKDTQNTVTFGVRSTKAKRTLYDTDKVAWDSLVKYIKTSVVPEILYYEDFIFDIPEKVFFPKTDTELPPEANTKQQEMWRLVLDDVVRSVHTDMTIQTQVADKIDNDKDGVDNLIAKMAGELNSKITKAWTELFSSESRKISFKEILLVCNPATNGVELAFKVKTQTDQVFSLNERSKGFKWFFAFLLFTEFRKNRSENILFLLDEPASNLHSSAQAKLLNAINGLSDKSLVVYSTHSHHLVNPLWLSGAYVVMNEFITDKNLSGEINLLEGAKISAMRYYEFVGKGLASDNVSYFQPILDALDYKPSTVEPVPDIIVLEGRNDWYTLNYVQQVILKRTSSLNFYPGGGADKLHEIIRLYLSWGKKFLIMLDGDKSGEKAKQTYLKEFGPILNDRIFTLKDATNKSCFMEDLFGVQDLKAMYDEVFGKGSYDSIQKSNPTKLKANVNLAIANLLIQQKEVSLNKSSVQNFEKIFSFLEGKL